MKKTALLIFILNIFACVTPHEAQIKELDTEHIVPFKAPVYWATDRALINEVPNIREALGSQINLLIEGLDCTSLNELQNMLESAEALGIKLIIWPYGNGHQWTPWKWTGSDWDISEGLDFLAFVQAYASSGGTALHSFLMSHEPFWNNGDPFSSDQMKMLYAKLDEQAPDVKKFIYIGNMSLQEEYYAQAKDGIKMVVESGLADVVCIWWHGFGGQEGAPTDEQILELVRADRAIIEDRKLDMELFFALQCFGWSKLGYRMPTAQEILDLGNKVLSLELLDGLVWYSWGDYSAYSESLKKDDVDEFGVSRYEAIRYLHGISVK